MTAPDDTPDTRSRIGGLIFLGALALIVVGGPLVFLFVEQSQTIAAEEEQLDLQRAKIAAAPTAKQALAEARAYLGAFGGFLHASNASLAQAALQNEVKTVLDANKAVLHSADPGSVTSRAGIDKVSVQFDATVPASHLRETLYGLETHAPYLFVTDIQITGAPSSATSDRNGELELRMTVAAFRAGNAT